MGTVRGMHRNGPLVVVPRAAWLGLAVATVAHAQDVPVRADPRTETRWAKDEVVRAAVAETTETRMQVPGAGPGMPALGGTTSIEADFRVRCLEADEAGRLLRSRVRIDRFAVRTSLGDDACLEGAVVETSAAGWTLVAAPANPSRLARGWLANRFGPRGRGFSRGLAELGAVGPVAAGEAWTADPPAIAWGLTAGGNPGHIEPRKWTFRVAEVVPTAAGPSAKVEFDESFDVTAAASAAEEQLSIEEGSTVRTRGHLAGVPGAWHRTGRMDVVSEQKIVATAAGRSIEITGTASEREAWTAGGEAPERPETGPVERRALTDAGPLQAGDAWTETGREVTTTRTTPVGTDGSAGATMESVRTFAWRAEVVCAAVDADGDPRSLLVTLADWSAVEDDTTDAALAGAVVRVGVNGFRVLEGDAGTGAAREWLERRFGDGIRKDDPTRAAMSPAMLVAPGTTWATDPMDTMLALAPRFDVPIEPRSLRGKGTLTTLTGSGAGAEASVDYEIDGVVSCAPGCGGENAELLKGVVRVRGTARGPADRWARLGSLRDVTDVTANVPGLSAGEELRRVAVTDVREIVRAPLSEGALRARRLTVAARAKSDAGDAAGAAAECTQAIASDPAYANAWTGRAWARIALKEHAGAVEDATKAVTLDGRSSDAWAALVAAQSGAGDAAAAAATCVRWTAALPSDARAWTQKARLRAEAGDVEGAIEDYGAAIERNPEHADAWSRRAHLRFRREEYAQAIEDWSEAIELRPRDAVARCNRGNAYAASGDYDAAIADSTRAIELDPKYARAWFTRAIARGGKRDREGQLADCARALELSPKFVAVLNYRASVLEQGGEHEAAIADRSRAIELDPKSAEAWVGRGRSKCALGDDEGAVADCTQAIELEPSNVDAHLERADARAALFDDAGAAADWARAAELDPEDGRARFALARFAFRPGLPAAEVVASLRAELARGRRLDYGNLWLWLARTQLGEEEAATRDLAAHVASRAARRGSSDGAAPAAGDEDDDWYPHLAGFLTGAESEEALFAAAASAEGRTQAERTCEAAYYAGVVRALRGRPAEAIERLDRCLATGVRTFTEFADARGWRPALAFGAVTRAADLPGAAPGARVLAGTDPKGPAARAGLRDGDVVVAEGGSPLTPGRLDRLLVTSAPGTVLRLEALRDGARVTAEVKLCAW